MCYEISVRKKELTMQKRPSARYILRDLPSELPFSAVLGNYELLPYNSEEIHGFHDCSELVYCHSGSGVFLSEDKSFAFHEGDLLFISPYTPHYLYKTGEKRCRCEFMHANFIAMFDPVTFPEIVEIAEQLLMPFSIPPVISMEAYPVLRELIQMLFEEAKNSKPYFELSVRGYCMSIVAKLKEVWEEQEKSVNQDSKVSLYPALIYMNRNYSENIMIPELAKICHISETHFRRLFKNKFKVSPIDYLNYIRIHEACVLLSRRSMLISEVAELTGYQTLSSFNRNFLEIMQMSPTKWIKQRLNSVENKYIIYYE